MSKGLASKQLAFKHSLQKRLLVTLAWVCLLFSLLVAMFGFYQGYRQAQALQDTKLANLVSLVKSHDFSIQHVQMDIALDDTLASNVSDHSLKIKQNSSLPIFIYWLDDQRLSSYFDHSTLERFNDTADGLYEVQGHQGLWRLYLYTDNRLTQKAHHDQRKHVVHTQMQMAPTGHRLIIGELLDVRNRLAWQSAREIVIPLLLLIPLLLTVIAMTIHNVFRPLDQVTALFTPSMSKDDPQSLAYSTVSTLKLSQDALSHDFLVQLDRHELPSEMWPFIAVIRTQMQRLVDSIHLNERFVSNAAHQLRTPMTAILLQAEQLKHSNFATPDTITQHQQTIDNLLESIKRSNDLINQLLTLSKSEQKLPASSFVAFSTRQVITEVLLDYYLVAEQKQISLGVNQLQDLVLAIPELHFKIIVQNLIDNAIKYTPIGGRVDINLFKCNDKAILHVQDCGIGIAQADLARIFEPFYRAHPAMSSDVEGNTGDTSLVQSTVDGFGLGLAIVHNLVHTSQAQLTIANHRQIDPQSADYQPALSALFYVCPSDQTADAPLSHALLPQPSIQAFTQGILVQVVWTLSPESNPSG